MGTRSHLQLLSKPGEAPGSAGFKLTGVARAGDGLCRVWLRRTCTWNRYLDPRLRSATWDVRCYTRADSAFCLVEDFGPASLDDLAERYEFDVPAAELAPFADNGDPVHDTVLAWARATLNGAAPAESAVSEPSAVADDPSDDTTAADEAEAPAEAAPADETPEAAEVAEVAPAAASDSAVDQTPAETADAWDEIAVMAERATGAHVATDED